MSRIAAEIMTTPVVTVPPTASAADIATLLAGKRISAVPVVDDDGRLQGIVSESDILRPFRETARQKRDWWLGLIAEGGELSQEYLDYVRRDTRTARELMARAVVTATEDATLPQLAEIMMSHNARRVPVVRDGRVVGIVSRADLIAAIAREPAMLV